MYAEQQPIQLVVIGLMIIFRITQVWLQGYHKLGLNKTAMLLCD